MKNEIHVYDTEEYSQKVAQFLCDRVQQILQDQSICSLVLSGGTTPQALYSLLSKNKELFWNRIHIFFSDERYVPHTNPQSNYYGVYENLLKYISIPKENIHAIPTDFDDPSDASHEYDKEIRTFFKKFHVSEFDVVLLGLGEDCHTASLFPRSTEIHEKKQWVLPVFNSPKPPPTRITLTYPILNASKNIYFLVTGEKKAEAVKRVLQSSESIEKCPAKGVIPQNPTIWFLDIKSSKLISV